jgi:hypothetical protein
MTDQYQLLDSLKTALLLSFIVVILHEDVPNLAPAFFYGKKADDVKLQWQKIGTHARRPTVFVTHRECVFVDVDVEHFALI